MIEFSKYAKIKNNYCLCYFGNCDEYLVQLRLIRPALERKFSGLKLFLGCRDDRAHLLNGNVLLQSELRSRYEEFAQVKEITFDGAEHPVEQLLRECGITVTADTPPPRDHTNIFAIITKANHPTRNLETRHIETFKKMAKEDGYEVRLDCDVDQAGVVAGVESLQLFEAASRGIKTILVPTGVGTRLYRNLFPNGVVLHN